MKTLLLSFGLGLGLASPLLSQNNGQGDTHRNFTIVNQQEASYPGGNEALYKFFNEKMQYPAEAKAKHIEGDIYLSFFVEPDSSVSNIVAMNDLGYGTSAEAIRVLKLAKFSPAIQNGKPIRQNMMLPMMFRIYE